MSKCLGCKTPLDEPDHEPDGTRHDAYRCYEVQVEHLKAEVKKLKRLNASANAQADLFAERSRARGNEIKHMRSLMQEVRDFILTRCTQPDDSDAHEYVDSIDALLHNPQE